MSWDRRAKVRVTLELEVSVSANREEDAKRMIRHEVAHRLGMMTPSGTCQLREDELEILELEPEGDCDAFT